MRHAAGYRHTSEAALWHSSHSKRCCAIQMALPNLMARGPTRSAIHVVGQEQLGAGWMGSAKAGFFAAGVAAMLSYAFVVRKKIRKWHNNEKLVGLGVSTNLQYKFVLAPVSRPVQILTLSHPPMTRNKQLQTIIRSFG